MTFYLYELILWNAEKMYFELNNLRKRWSFNYLHDQFMWGCEFNFRKLVVH